MVVRFELPRLRVTLTTLVALVALLAGESRSASAGPTLQETLKSLAKEVVAVVKVQNQSAIAVGDFIGPADLDTNAGPGLAEALKSLLNELQPGIVQRKAFLSLRGRYDKIADPKDPATLVLIKVTAEITDNNAQRIDEKFAEIRDTRILTDLIGVTVALPADVSQPVANQIVQSAISRPAFVGEGTKIRATADSPFAIEVLVTSKAAVPSDAKGWRNVPARATRKESGQAFVDLERDEVYAIRVHNDLKQDGVPQETAVYLTIDGLDVFAFSEIRDPKTNRSKYSHYVLSAGASLITGWHKTNDRVDSFLVTEYGKGAISSQPNVSRGKVGVITVQFAPVITERSKSADDRASARGGRDRKETGFGPSAKVQLNEVARTIGEIRESISVRYSR